MERLVSLRTLNIAKNQLGDLDYLLVLGETKMQDIDFSYNRLPVSYLDQLLEILTALKTLRKITFTGNELALNKFYRVKICSVLHLNTLDGLKIKPYARNQLREQVEADQIDKLIVQTNMDYLQRMQQEESLKNRVLSTLDQKKMQIQNNFIEYMHECEQDQLNFLRWAREFKQTKGDPGTDVGSETLTPALGQSVEGPDCRARAREET